MGQDLRTDGRSLFDRARVRTAEQGLGLLANVLESATEYSVIATDCDGEIVLWNEGARRLYGYDADDVLGRHTAMLHPAADADAGLPQRMLHDALADGRWVGFTERVRKDGTRFAAHVVLTPRHAEDGEHAGFVLVSRDSTEQLRLTRELERAQSYARSLIESAPDAMVIVNGDGGIRLANAETERLFGYDREELIGHPVEILIPERFQGHHPATGRASSQRRGRAPWAPASSSTGGVATAASSPSRSASARWRRRTGSPSRRRSGT